MRIVTTLGKLRSIVSEALLHEASATQKDVIELVNKFPAEMKRIGIDPNKIASAPVLGTGTHGTAVDMGNGKVLKVTDDAAEAKAASAMLGVDSDRIVKFYDVWHFGDTPFYGIMQEKLLPLSDEEGKAINAAFVATGMPVWIKRASGSWDKVKELTKQYVADQIKKKFKSVNEPEAKEFVEKINAAWDLLVTKYGIRDVFKELAKLGIDFHDFHAGNLMKRQDGSIVLIDLGMSRVKSSGDIRSIEKTA